VGAYSALDTPWLVSGEDEGREGKENYKNSGMRKFGKKWRGRG